MYVAERIGVKLHTQLSCGLPISIPFNVERQIRHSNLSREVHVLRLNMAPELMGAGRSPKFYGPQHTLTRYDI